MAIFSNQATLTYNGSSTNSNIAYGEILDVLAVTKTAVEGSYTSGSTVTYAVALRNTGSSTLSGLTVTDNLGGYTFNGTTVYPLTYVDGSALLYVNGVVQPAPTVTAGPPLVFSGITIPAGGNAIVIYEATVTAYAPLAASDTITNTATITATGLSSPVTVTAIISTEDCTLLWVAQKLVS